MIPNNFKPMLASAVEQHQVEFPVYTSPKLNGVRCIIFGGVAYSRSLKHLPNNYIQQWACVYGDLLEGLDGEIIVGSETDSQALNNTTSGVMSIDGAPNFKFFVFDIVANLPFSKRIVLLQSKFDKIRYERVSNISLVQQFLTRNITELKSVEQTHTSLGYEGTMIRHPEGGYKFGRSTLNQGWLLKRKGFVDDEFEIVGYEEKYHNNNEAYTNELGRTTRSTSKANLEPADTLGALVCKTKFGHTFNVGTGFTDAQRKQLWNEKEKLIGKMAKIKYFPEGMQDVPLLPVFLQIRNPIDT
jgi:DNA ligase-1